MALLAHPREHGVIFIINRRPRADEVAKTHIANGDRVNVCVDDDCAFITGVEVLGNGRYRGLVEEFERSPYGAVGDIAIDDIVEFEEKHVSACMTD